METLEVYNQSDIVNFMKVNEEYRRMQGFTTGGKELNPKTRARQYVDELFERESTIAYSPNIPYNFDRVKDNPIHEEIAKIHDDEIVNASVEILTVNMITKEARLRSYSVNPENQGDDNEAYTYAGSFHANGSMTKGTATVSADGMTATFTANEG